MFDGKARDLVKRRRNGAEGDDSSSCYSWELRTFITDIMLRTEGSHYKYSAENWGHSLQRILRIVGNHHRYSAGNWGHSLHIYSWELRAITTDILPGIEGVHYRYSAENRLHLFCWELRAFITDTGILVRTEGNHYRYSSGNWGSSSQNFCYELRAFITDFLLRM
jgi:hypothetical protein